jgi:hypothetical protein
MIEERFDQRRQENTHPKSWRLGGLGGLGAL